MTFILLTTMAMTVTAYDGAKHVGANNHWPVNDHTCAAPRSVPFGTHLFIEGVGERVVTDRLSRRFDPRIDIYMGRGAAANRRAKRFGIQQRKVYVVTP